MFCVQYLVDNLVELNQTGSIATLFICENIEWMFPSN